MVSGADVVFLGGTVVTADPARPVASALAVAAGEIVALDDAAAALAGGAAEVVELAGRCALPGFRDGHIHPLWGGVELTQVPLVGATSLDELLARVKAYAEANPELAWIVGGGYPASALPGGVGLAEWLDSVVPDRPVALEANDHHTMWVSSRALEAAGITAGTPDPPLGRILRHPDGRPVGTLVEWGALDLVHAVLPPVGAAERLRGLQLAMAELAQSGITWVQEAAATPGDVAVYAELARRGGLTSGVNAAFRMAPGRWRGDLDAFVACRRDLEADPAVRDVLGARTVKFFVDGVIEMGTGALLEPYDDEPHGCGLPNWAPEELAEAARAADAAGFQVHLHAIGDGGVRMALDAVEHTARENGPRDRRPVIAHTQVVDPADRPRFAALGAIANFEPLWACLDDTMVDLTMPRLGPRRSALQYPIGSLLRAGARVSFGSDWPVTSMRPVEALAVAVTRQTPAGEPAGGWLPEERVPIHQAIAAYTAGTAYQGYDDDAGRLAVGCRADVCVLGADITTMTGQDVADVAVDGVWVSGREVHRRA
ncbi:MAG: amidohydrolase [Acidimicrobiales bacterium]|nr:amidohydrolase [Acidimicrobiales bacterium]